MKYLIANWKMQLTPTESVALAADVAANWIKDDGLGTVVTALCPSAVALESVGRVLRASPIALGGQNCFWEDRGAYTGEVSPIELHEAGAAYCIVGHSERRQFLGESDAMIRRKIEALLAQNVAPVLCVGETGQERESGQADQAVIAQLRAALEGARLGGGRLLVAYEPRWAIGTGVPVAPEEAARIHGLIRAELDRLLTPQTGGTQYAVLYGGSIDADNAASFVERTEIEGLLVGGASLKTEPFLKVARAVAAAAKRAAVTD